MLSEFNSEPHNITKDHIAMHTILFKLKMVAFLNSVMKILVL